MIKFRLAKRSSGPPPLNPPATDAERAWSRAQGRTVILRAGLKVLGLLVVFGVGLVVRARWVGGTRYHGAIGVVFPFGFVVIGMALVAFAQLRAALMTSRNIQLKRALDAVEAQKKQFLDALDEP